MTDREAIIEYIGAEICRLRQIYNQAGKHLSAGEIQTRNAEGWTIEARLPNSEYVGARDFTHIEGVVLSGPELMRAMNYQL